MPAVPPAVDDTPSAAPVPAISTARPRATSAASTPTPTPRRLAADLPPVNLAIRVRKPLDDALADLIHTLRGDGVRTSKVELIEMLLWESLPATPTMVRERLKLFRAYAPRGAGAPLDN